jgi:hypothetical protein
MFFRKDVPPALGGTHVPPLPVATPPPIPAGPFTVDSPAGDSVGDVPIRPPVEPPSGDGSPPTGH